MAPSIAQLMSYIKSKHRTDTVLSAWSGDDYWTKQKETLKLPKDFKDEIERIHVNDLTVE